MRILLVAAAAGTQKRWEESHGGAVQRRRDRSSDGKRHTEEHYMARGVGPRRRSGCWLPVAGVAPDVSRRRRCVSSPNQEKHGRPASPPPLLPRQAPSSSLAAAHTAPATHSCPFAPSSSRILFRPCPSPPPPARGARKERM
jgi:hypothetical protein